MIHYLFGVFLIGFGTFLFLTALLQMSILMLFASLLVVTMGIGYVISGIIK